MPTTSSTSSCNQRHLRPDPLLPLTVTHASVLPVAPVTRCLLITQSLLQALFPPFPPSFPLPTSHPPPVAALSPSFLHPHHQLHHPHSLFFLLLPMFSPSHHLIDINSLLSLYREFQALSLDSSPNAATFTRRLTDTARRLTDRGITITDSLLMARILDGLPPAYTTYKIAFITTRPETPSSSDIITWLLDAEADLLHTSLSTVALARGGSGGRGGFSGGYGGGRATGQSSFPGRSGGRFGSRPPGSGGRGGGRGGAAGTGTLPPCQYLIRYGSLQGQHCLQTTHATATCFKAPSDEWFERCNTGTPPRWHLLHPLLTPHDIRTSPTYHPPSSSNPQVLPPSTPPHAPPQAHHLLHSPTPSPSPSGFYPPPSPPPGFPPPPWSPTPYPPYPFYTPQVPPPVCTLDCPASGH
ncbi:unnamed protein product [Closterium sp. NIES-65]|nr:unnamed protein product [Closterium sp. NIES-65]